MHHRIFRHVPTLIKVGVMCIALMIAWSAWRNELQAHEPCPEGQNRDEFGFCVSPGADTPPSNEYLRTGEQWSYRGNGVWVSECVEPVGECKGRTYEAEVSGTSITVGSTDASTNAGVSGGIEASSGASGVNAPIPSPPPPTPPPEPPVAPPPDHWCAASSYKQALDTLASSSLDQCQYFVYMRRFASPKTFGGVPFHGDSRGVSTNLDVTSRTSGTFILMNDDRGTVLNVCSDPTILDVLLFNTTLTKTASPSATLINGNSLVDGSPLIIFTTKGANPLVPGSPDIDSRLDLQVRENSESITLSGTLRGDPFPSAEVFIVDTQGTTMLLTSYTTPLDSATGPYLWLPGDRDVRLGTFNVTIPKGEGGLCGRTGPLQVIP
jgi:hypothetical protein